MDTNDLERFNSILKKIKALDKAEQQTMAIRLVAGCKFNAMYAPIAMREAARIFDAILEDMEVETKEQAHV